MIITSVKIVRRGQVTIRLGNMVRPATTPKVPKKIENKLTFRWQHKEVFKMILTNKYIMGVIIINKTSYFQIVNRGALIPTYRSLHYGDDILISKVNSHGHLTSHFIQHLSLM